MGCPGGEGDLPVAEALAGFLRQGEKYKELAGFRSEYELIKRQILQSLKTDRGRKAWQDPAGAAVTGDDELFTAFTRLAQAYTSRQELERNMNGRKQPRQNWKGNWKH